MAEKLTDRTELTVTPAPGDLFHVIDISDLTDSPQGTSKKVRFDKTGVVGPASAVDGQIAVFDLTTGKLIKTVTVTIDSSGNVDLTATTTSQLRLPLNNDAVNPTIKFSNGGFYEINSTTIGVAIAGTARYQFNSGNLSSLQGSNRFQLRNAEPTAILPIYTFNADTDSGFSRAAPNSPCIVAGGVEAVRYTESTGVLARHQTNAGLTADAGAAQGGTLLTSSFNQVSTVVTIGDSVTLPSASAGNKVTIINTAANSLNVFPGSGDNLGQGVDAAAALSGGVNITYFAYDATNWVSLT